MLISDNSPVRKIISILTLNRMRMQGYCDVYKWTILKRASPEARCLHPTSSRREICTSSLSNVIYHEFSHGAAFYTLNEKNFNVMLEFGIVLASKGSNKTELIRNQAAIIKFAATEAEASVGRLLGL